MKRPIRIEGDIAYIPLTKGYEAVVDMQDIYLLSPMSWHARPDVRSVYAGTKARTQDGRRVTVRMHRLICAAPDDMEVDHINGDGLDNRRANLRLATKSQNQHNCRVRADNSSGYKGVVRKKGKWCAQIMASNKNKHLGCFNCPTAAHFAYIKASRALHGEFGRIA